MTKMMQSLLSWMEGAFSSIMYTLGKLSFLFFFSNPSIKEWSYLAIALIYWFLSI